MRLFLYPSLLAAFASLALPDTLQAGSIVVGHRVSAAGRQHEILRNERLYERMAAVRVRDAARFDRALPLYGKILGDSTSYNYYLWRWQLAPARFEFYHPLAWRLLDGRANVEARLGEATSQLVPGIPPLPTIPPTPPITPLPPIPPTPPTPPTPPVDPSPGPTPQGVVPEPSAALLMLVGVGILVVARAGNWVGRR